MAKQEPSNDELTKQREVRLSPIHPDAHQGESALALLSTLEAIRHVELADSHRLVVRYNVRDITLEIIEALLQELGFKLESSLLIKLKRSLYHYTEETQRTNLGLASSLNTKQIFIERYQQLRHGCRDDAPTDLRHYR